MKKDSLWFVFLGIGCVLNCAFIVPFCFSQSQDNPPASPQITAESIDLQPCRDEELGVRLLCHPDWEFEADNNALLMIVSSDPAVTVTIAKSNAPVIFLDQLTPEAIQEMGQYAPGFKSEV